MKQIINYLCKRYGDYKYLSIEEAINEAMVSQRELQQLVTAYGVSINRLALFISDDRNYNNEY